MHFACFGQHDTNLARETIKTSLPLNIVRSESSMASPVFHKIAHDVTQSLRSVALISPLFKDNVLIETQIYILQQTSF